MDNEELNEELNQDDLDLGNADELDADGNPKAKAEVELDADGKPVAAEDEILEVSLEGEESLASEEEQELAKAPKWVKELRTQHREVKRQLKTLQEENAKLKAPAAETQPAAVGPKPTLEACDFDEDRFAQEIEKWHDDKRKADRAKEQQAEQQKATQQAWDAKLQGYAEKKGKLKLPDFEEAEDRVKEKLSLTQQGIILHGAKDPALVVYALGKSQKKLEELSKVTDPVQFAFAVADVQRDMKVTRKQAPQPEEGETRSNRSTSSAVDSELERLRADAAKTGDFTKVTQYKRQLRAKTQ